MIELIQTIPAVVSYHFFRRCFRRRWWKEAELLSPLCAAIPPHVDDDVRPDYVNVLMPPTPNLGTLYPVVSAMMMMMMVVVQQQR